MMMPLLPDSVTSKTGPTGRDRSRATPTSLRFIVVNTLLLWLAVAVASVQVWTIYQDARFVILAAVTTLVGSAIAIAGARFRLSTAAVVAAGVLAFIVLGVPLAVPDAAVAGVLPTPDGIRQLLVATALGWKQLVTITLPVGSYQSLLVPAFVVILVTVVGALTAALRARAGDVAVFGPVIVLLFGIAFGPETARVPLVLVLSLCLLAIVLAWIMWRRWNLRRAAIARLTAATTDVGGAPSVAGEHRILGVRTILSGALIILIASVTAVGATQLFPPLAQREVIRSAIVQPFDPRDYVSPLAGFRRYLQPPTDNAVILSVTGLPEDSFLRIAALDSYDGIVYAVGSDAVDSASGEFTRVPYRFDQSDVSGDPVTIDVTVGDYDGVWLPTVGLLEGVTFQGGDASKLKDSFYYNNNAATGAVIGGLHEGDRYSLDAVLPTQPAPGLVGAFRPGSATVPALGVVPAELDIALSSWTAGAGAQGSQLAAMLEALAETGYISHGIGDEPVSPSGHSAQRITRLLTDQRMIGDEEQYAVTAALMAREIGFPARVVFGFDTTDAAVRADGTVDITGADVTARIEVDTEQFGWVLIDPTPPEREIPKAEPEDPTVVSRPPSVVQPPVVEPPTRDTPTPPESRQQDPEQVSPFFEILELAARIVGVIALVLGLLISPFIAIVGAKLRRRRARRRAATPVERISGGWREFEDSALDHGYTPPAGSTRSQVAREVGGAGPVVLAGIADRAVFSPDSPDDAEADRVWRAVRDLTAAMDSGLTRWQRITARISLRSFGRPAPQARAARREPRAGTRRARKHARKMAERQRRLANQDPQREAHE